MRTYTIGKYNVQAKSLEQAKSIVNHLIENNIGRCIIFFDENTKALEVIPLPVGDRKVFVVDGNDVSYVGASSNPAGLKLITASIDSLSRNVTLKANSLKSKLNRRDNFATANDFKNKMPEDARQRFAEICSLIGFGVSDIAVISNAIDASGVQIKSDKWSDCFAWFCMHVMPEFEKHTKYELRKSIITAIIKLMASDRTMGRASMKYLSWEKDVDWDEI